MAMKTQHVIPYRGKWAVKAEDDRRVALVFEKKADAIDAAHDLARSKGGDVLVHGRDGQPFYESPMGSKISEGKIRSVLRDRTIEGSRSAAIRAIKKKTRKTAETVRDGAPSKASSKRKPNSKKSRS